MRISQKKTEEPDKSVDLPASPSETIAPAQVPQVAAPATHAWQPFLIPLSIIVAGIAVGGGIVLSSLAASKQNVAPASSAQTTADAQLQELAKNVTAPSSQDHIRGSLNARVKLIEFVDLECPYCEQYHPVLKSLVVAYSPDQVAWIYRHFPLTSIHAHAQIRAEASECVASIAGEAAFWKFIDAVFQNTSLPDDQLVDTARAAGVTSRQAFESCLNSHQFASLIAEQENNGVNSGVTGTPHTILMADGRWVAIQGVTSYSVLKSKVDDLLK